MDCDIEDDWPTLEEVVDDETADSSVRTHAMRLITKFGFKRTDKLCEDCFWK